MTTTFRFPLAIRHYYRKNGMDDAIAYAIRFCTGETPLRREVIAWILSISKREKEEE